MEKLLRNKGRQSQRVELKKLLHKKQILYSLFINQELSNAELSGKLKLSTPKITSLVAELIDDKLLQELGQGDSSGGRRPSIYGLEENGFFVVGITINISRTIISVFNAKNNDVSGPHFIKENILSGYPVFKKVKIELDIILEKSGIPISKILAVGIELPGLYDQKNGINKTYFPDIENLGSKLKKLFETPVYINHDSKVRAFAEKHFGLAKNKKNALMLQIDWGVGLGILINGKLYAGKSGFSGEFGHLPIAENGYLCNCGKKGCLETIVSAKAIARIAMEKIAKGQPSLITRLVDGQIQNIDISVIIDAANQGDQFAISVFADVGYSLGKGIVYLIQIFNPELVIIGGRVAEARPYITAPIQQAIQTFSNRIISNDTEIKFSELGTKAGTMGAAAYALEQVTLAK